MKMSQRAAIYRPTSDEFPWKIDVNGLYCKFAEVTMEFSENIVMWVRNIVRFGNSSPYFETGHIF